MAFNYDPATFTVGPQRYVIGHMLPMKCMEMISTELLCRLVASFDSQILKPFRKGNMHCKHCIGSHQNIFRRANNSGTMWMAYNIA